MTASTAAGLQPLLDPLVADRHGPVPVLSGTGRLRGECGREGLAAIRVPRGQRHRAIREVRRSGLVCEGAFAYRVGRRGRDAVLVQLDSRAIRRALADRAVRSHCHRLVGRAAASRLGRVALIEALRSVALVVRRPDTPELGGWLSLPEHEPGRQIVVHVWGPAASRTALVRLSGRARDGFVAKVATDDRAEARFVGEHAMTARLRDDAHAAGASVPRAWIRRLGRRHALVTDEMDGTRAWELISADRRMAPQILSRMADWLERWNARTVRPRRLTAPDLDRLIDSPASLLGLPRGSRARLESLCRSSVGAALPLVASHGDLTVHNVLVAGDGRLAILDWECADPAGLPMADLAYAALDIVRAARPDQDRLRAFDALRAGSDPLARQAVRLIAAHADALGLHPLARDLCWTACWLHHAANEMADGTEPGRPFGAIARLVAAGEVVS